MKNFITFEGCEGVGKSTQIKRIHQYMQAFNCLVILTREPGGSEIAEKIRGIILDKDNTALSGQAELLLYLAARAQHLEEIVKPALNDGQIVLCDRYIDSTYAYQGVARGLGAEKVRALNALTVGEYVPDFTVFLDCPPHIAFARKGGIDKDDRMEREGMEFHNKVYEGYLKIAKAEPERFIRIDARGTKEETHEKILKLFEERGLI